METTAVLPIEQRLRCGGSSSAQLMEAFTLGHETEAVLNAALESPEVLRSWLGELKDFASVGAARNGNDCVLARFLRTRVMLGISHLGTWTIAVSGGVASISYILGTSTDYLTFNLWVSLPAWANLFIRLVDKHDFGEEVSAYQAVTMLQVAEMWEVEMHDVSPYSPSHASHIETQKAVAGFLANVALKDKLTDWTLAPIEQEPELAGVN